MKSLHRHASLLHSCCWQTGLQVGRHLLSDQPRPRLLSPCKWQGLHLALLRKQQPSSHSPSRLRCRGAALQLACSQLPHSPSAPVALRRLGTRTGQLQGLCLSCASCARKLGSSCVTGSPLRAMSPLPCQQFQMLSSSSSSQQPHLCPRRGLRQLQVPNCS